MKKTVLVPAVLLSLSSVGLVSALIKDRNERTSVVAPEPTAPAALPAALPVAPVPVNEAAAAPQISRSFQAFLKIFPSENLPYAFDEAACMRIYMQEIQAQKERHRNDTLPEDMTERLRMMDENTNTELQREHALKKRLEPNSDLIRQIVKGSAVVYFSRIPQFYEPVALLTTDAYYTAVYSLTDGFGHCYKMFYAATFDQTGAMISNVEVGKIYPESVATFLITSNLTATVSHRETQWAQDPDETDMKDNSVAAFRFVKSASIDLKKRRRSVLPRHYLPAPKLPAIKVETIPDTILN